MLNAPSRLMRRPISSDPTEPFAGVIAKGATDGAGPVQLLEEGFGYSISTRRRRNDRIRREGVCNRLMQAFIAYLGYTPAE